MKLVKFESFVNEKFFSRISKGKKTTNKSSRIEMCVNDILNFLSEHDIYNWDRFMNMSPFDRELINKMIDRQVKDMEELKEVRFKVRVELSNRQQLLELKNELESQEEYEKCAFIVKRLSQK